MWLNGPRALVLSFVALIVIGTLILMLPAMSAPGHSLAWVDALFLATSAACVTGLATVNYADMLSTAGHATLLVLFQLGGLGIMTFSAAFAALLGRGISPSNHLALSDAFSGGRSIHLNRLLYYSLAICFVTEAMGAVAIYALLDSDTPTGHRIWTAIFHSVSAFCNAGFSIYPENLMRWQHNRAAATVVMALIIVGGLGFFVVLDLIDWRQGRTPFLRLQTKLVLSWSVTLIALGAIFIYMSERANPQTLALLSEPDRWFHAVFQSVSARTAGFNTIDLTSATQAGMVSIIALMFVGGSPGSTSGGVKTTTFGIVMAALWSHLCGREDVEVFRRRIPRPQTQRAFLIVAMSVAIMIVGLILMTLAGGYHPPSGRDPLMPLAFEVVSGFCTVGYSSGASSELNSLSKVVMCALMFAGRLGPLTLAVAVISERKAPLYRLPAESVMVG